ncbi:hypothetical protein FRC10_008459 [Ceratobasidium sp. 414]|nr:hypothetical protein FRC10_008459 [Ceratobasidium sp. 414]
MGTHFLAEDWRAPDAYPMKCLPHMLALSTFRSNAPSPYKFFVTASLSQSAPRFEAQEYIPTPFVSWKARCFTTQWLQRKIYFGLQGETENAWYKVYENGCFIEQVLARQAEFGMTREQIVYLAGVLIGGGSDTTSPWHHHSEALTTQHEFTAAESAFVGYEHGLREEDQAYVQAQRM